MALAKPNGQFISRLSMAYLEGKKGVHTQMGGQMRPPN